MDTSFFLFVQYTKEQSSGQNPIRNPGGSSLAERTFFEVTVICRCIAPAYYFL